MRVRRDSVRYKVEMSVPVSFRVEVDADSQREAQEEVQHFVPAIMYRWMNVNDTCRVDIGNWQLDSVTPIG